MAFAVIIFGIIFSGFVQRPCKELIAKIRTIPGLHYPLLTVDYALQFVIVILSVGSLIGGTYNAFIYFQF
jgi:hypothetical protein